MIYPEILAIFCKMMLMYLFIREIRILFVIGEGESSGLIRFCGKNKRNSNKLSISNGEDLENLKVLIIFIF